MKIHIANLIRMIPYIYIFETMCAIAARSRTCILDCEYFTMETYISLRAQECARIMNRNKYCVSCALDHIICQEYHYLKVYENCSNALDVILSCENLNRVSNVLHSSYKDILQSLNGQVCYDCEEEMKYEIKDK